VVSAQDKKEFLKNRRRESFWPLLRHTRVKGLRFSFSSLLLRSCVWSVMLQLQLLVTERLKYCTTTWTSTTLQSCVVSSASWTFIPASSPATAQSLTCLHQTASAASVDLLFSLSSRSTQSTD